MKFIAIKKTILLFTCIVLLQLISTAQRRRITADGTTGTTVTHDAQGRPLPPKPKGTTDSLQKRDRYADSITIFYRYYDSSSIRF
ncbi:MAG TPA: hypothetical protein PLH33_10195, partial [Chitinophagaceae bacterium]|nr:hypothetical protein [Chitinophagaceae bacterium]